MQICLSSGKQEKKTIWTENNSTQMAVEVMKLNAQSFMGIMNTLQPTLKLKKNKKLFGTQTQFYNYAGHLMKLKTSKLRTN